MGIRVLGQEKLFMIETDHTMYQMKVDEYGVLQHLWYGKKTGCNMDYLYDYPDLGFAGNIDEAGNRRTYSLNTLPQEYSTDGIGDFRLSALAIKHQDGSQALDLRYQSYEIKDVKDDIPGLPSAYAGKEKAQTLEITLQDMVTKVQVILKYSVIGSLDVIMRSTVIRNAGESKITIQKASSLCLDLAYGEWEWVHFHGRHAMERQMERMPIMHGIQESSSKRGTSSHQQNPTVLLCQKYCTETSGECFGAALVYSGNFQTQIECDQLSQIRLVMGIHPDSFEWQLSNGEEFYTPEVILSYSSQGFGQLSTNFHKIIRQHICRGKYKEIARPVLINNWEATYFDFNDNKLLKIANEAARLGVDMLVMDDGWFGKREDDTSGLGDWFVNEQKLKGGLGKLVEQINELGIKFGIWFEPEMISEDSELYRNHSEWVIQIPGRKPVRGRYQLVLDMTRKDVRDYLFEVISEVLHSANIEYVKWDMNRSICDLYSLELPSDRQGEFSHRYVLGVYELLERLINEFPDILFEGCSGGGGRFDAGMLYYTPQIWCSDNTDAYDRVKIQYGTSFFYPMSTIGSHISAVPNHQTGRVTSIETRAVVAMAGSFGYELDLNRLSEEEKELVKSQITQFKKYDPLIHKGTYYRLSNPMKEPFGVWEYVSEDKKEALVQGVIFRTEASSLRYRICLRGLEETMQYELVGTEQSYSGQALMNGGVLLPRTWGDYAPIELYFRAMD
ncbi:alpha-galactosidase [Lachnospiraceae bacterium KM106-2]|nr:alpha-galactosidase [Lachnospiraceae bacterium KM106-2]